MFLTEKTTQVAAKVIRYAGGTMPYIALLKLLYLADKEMLLTWGTPMTYDEWYAMSYGPVLGNTYDLIKANPAPNDNYWNRYIRKENYDVKLVDDPGDGLLSEADDAAIDKVWAEHGGKDKWELVALTHKFPEWKTPRGSSCPITYEEVLRNSGLFTHEAIEDFLENIRVTRGINKLFADAEEVFGEK